MSLKSGPEQCIIDIKINYKINKIKKTVILLKKD